MEGFTVIDAVVAGVIVLSALLAYSRGLVRELMAIAGWVVAAILAFVFAPAAEPLVKEIPYVGSFLRDSCELALIAAFCAIFALALIVVSFFTPLLGDAVQRSAIGGIDQGLGFLYGALRGIVLVIVALVVYDRLVISDTVPMVEQSRTASVFASIEADLDAQIPQNAPNWVVERYEELVGGCGAPA